MENNKIIEKIKEKFKEADSFVEFNGKMFFGIPNDKELKHQYAIRYYDLKDGAFKIYYPLDNLEEYLELLAFEKKEGLI